MREQSHKHEMSAAIRGDFERLRERGVAATLAPRDGMPSDNACVESTQASGPAAPLAETHSEPSMPAALVQVEPVVESEVENMSVSESLTEPEPKSFKEPAPEPEAELASAESSSAPESKPAPGPDPGPLIEPRTGTGDPSPDGERPGFLARLLGR